MEQILRKEIIVNKTACRALVTFVFASLIMLGAFVRIPLPFTPVPVTLQTLFVLLAGAFLGSSWGLGSVAVYSLAGIIGMQVFSNSGSGFLYLLGPTGGYIAGFFLCSYITGKIAGKSDINYLGVTLIFALSSMVILICGALWLGLLFHLGLTRSILLGVVPFVPGEILKIFAAGGIYYKLRSRAREIF